MLVAALAAVLRDLAPFLRRVVFVSEAVLGDLRG
jgi:hypothetical protein